MTMQCQLRRATDVCACICELCWRLQKLDWLVEGTLKTGILWPHQVLVIPSAERVINLAMAYMHLSQHAPDDTNKGEAAMQLIEALMHVMGSRCSAMVVMRLGISPS